MYKYKQQSHSFSKKAQFGDRDDRNLSVDEEIIEFDEIWRKMDCIDM